MSLPQNTYEASLRKLDEIAKLETRPKLLLHACCGPCASGCLPLIYDYFDITIYFSNSNIFPKKEYDRRLEELKSFLVRFNEDYLANIKLVVDEYRPEEFLSFATPLKDLKEGQERCHLCYAYRMEKGMVYAKENDFDYFTTVLTLSRLKNSTVINQIGEKLEKKYPEVNYFYSDFKKNKGIDLSVDMTEKYHMYRQDYCGCPYGKKHDVSL